jgi:glucose/mannose transport system substrate-binding protein
VAACNGSASDSTNQAQSGLAQVTLFSWWIAPSENDALEALIAVHAEKYPKERIYNAAIASGAKAKEALAANLAANTPPDLFQEAASDIAGFLKDNPNTLVSLSDFFSQEQLLDVIVPEVIADVTANGQIWAMPVNMHRENSLHYNKKIFADLDLAVPTTLAELLATCEQLKAAGITPLAMGYDGWVIRILFNSLAAASLGPAAFESYFTGKTPLDESGMSQAIALLDNVLTNYVNASASDPNFLWTDAADLLLNGQAAMFIHGDWAKGYLTQLGWKPGVGFDVVGVPGTAELFLYGVDTFALPIGGPQPEAAQHFLQTVASKEGQVAFNKLKGSSTVRLDISPDEFDPAGQATLADLRNAKLRMLTRSKSEWDAAFLAFATSRDKAALLSAFVTSPPDA